MFRVLTLSIVIFLTYIIGYSSGYNRGYDAGQCAAMPWKDQLDCWRKIQ